MMTALPFQAEQPAFARMGELANYANLSYEEQERYMRSLDTWRTVQAAEQFSLQKGEQKGLEKGLEKGRAEGEVIGMQKGRLEERIANAMTMKSLGIDISMIAQVTKLTHEEIENL